MEITENMDNTDNLVDETSEIGITDNMDNTDNIVDETSEIGITDNVDNTDNLVDETSEIGITDNVDNTDNLVDETSEIGITDNNDYTDTDMSVVPEGSSSGSIDISPIIEKLDIVIGNTDIGDSIQEMKSNTEYQTLYSNIEDLRSTDILLLLILVVLSFNALLKIGGKIF